MRSSLELSPDDLYILYTGGTTGMPKGVLWRQADIFVAALGGRGPGGVEPASYAEIAERAKAGGAKSLPTPPLMHGAAHWASFNGFHAGNTVVFQGINDRFDPHDALSHGRAREGERDADRGRRVRAPAARPAARAHLRPVEPVRAGLRRRGAERDAQEGAARAPAQGDDHRRGRLVGDRLAGAEHQHAGLRRDHRHVQPGLRRVRARPRTCRASLAPGHEGLGWFAQTGRVPLGYLGDRAKTERTFPALDGVRYSVPGDRARLRADGVLELLGRDSVTINSGGEKIFAEEVEHALKSHPAVFDAVVCGRPSERWGNEVVAIVRLREGKPASEADLLEECAKHIARYKLPKAFLFRDEIVRSPSGKADYRWAKEQAIR